MRMIFGLPSLVLAGIIALSSSASAQDLEAKLAAKMAKPFVTNAAWVLDYDEALAKSKESGKVIFAYFTRSYAP